MKESFKSGKYDLFLITLLLLSIAVFIAQVYYVSKIWYVGYLDLQHFANAAENLIKGRGFALDYINQYFIKLNSISHPEEWDSQAPQF